MIQNKVLAIMCHKFDHPQLTDNFVIDSVFEREEEKTI